MGGACALVIVVSNGSSALCKLVSGAITEVSAGQNGHHLLGDSRTRQKVES